MYVRKPTIVLAGVVIIVAWLLLALKISGAIS